MLIGLGHDLQMLAELEGQTALWEPGVFFTEAETERFRQSADPLQSFGAGFSAKESLFKALPPLEGGWFWTDVEVLADSRKAPLLRFHGKLREHAEREGWVGRLSISHSGGFVSTVVTLEVRA